MGYAKRIERLTRHVYDKRFIFFAEYPEIDWLCGFKSSTIYRFEVRNCAAAKIEAADFRRGFDN
jgi:hypothetical protein